MLKKTFDIYTYFTFMITYLNSNWQTILVDEIQKPYFSELLTALENEYANTICFPKKELLFEALNKCDFEEIKVVILGQDPYHGEGEANGLCFSVNEGVAIPPSLRNIYREITTDLNTIFTPNSGNLERWATQGILLLNSCLSVQKDKPNSHKHLKWNRFTDAVIQKISDEKEGVVFLLWGSFAKKKGIYIDRNKHLVLESGHPSPMSANQGKWFGNAHFSQTNNYLRTKGHKEIEW